MASSCAPSGRGTSGGQVSGRRQAGLSAYWQWVVATYGPALLEALGTFRFLLTELVPLQLVHQNRSAGRAYEGGEGRAPPSGGEASEPDDGDEIPF